MAGLQGVGKTTAAGKLALYLKKAKKSVLLVATDVYRPAAIDQLVKLGAAIDVPVFEMGTDVSLEVFLSLNLLYKYRCATRALRKCLAGCRPPSTCYMCPERAPVGKPWMSLHTAGAATSDRQA